MVQDLNIINLSIIDSSSVQITKDLAVILGATLISAFIPLVILYRLKPIEIIHSKEV